MTQFTNIGQAFPLEKLGSDLARNGFNYESILNGLIDWDKTTSDTVNIRLTKETEPWFEDFSIPSKKALFDLDSIEVSTIGSIDYNSFAVDYILDTVVSGGSHVFTETTFRGDLDVDIVADEVYVIDSTEFVAGDVVVLSTSDGTIPGGLNDTKKFTLRSAASNTFTFYDEDDEEVDITGTGSGTITITKVDSDPSVDETDAGDILTLRLTANDNGLSEWETFYYQLVSEWTQFTPYKFGNLVSYEDLIYKVIVDIDNSVSSPLVDTGHFELLIKAWTNGDSYLKNDLVSYDGSLYKVNAESLPLVYTAPPEAIASNSYELYATQWVSGTSYNKGTYVFYSGNPYVAKSAVNNSTTSPVDAPTIWEFAVIISIPTMPLFELSTVGRWRATVDATKFVLKNVSTTKTPSTPETNISMRSSFKTRDPDSIYQKSVEVFSTSNYAFWPDDKTALWNVFNPVPTTNDGLLISERQDYSAVMVFEHTNAAIAKTVNYVNYDGPDLDQGLCVYLPVEIPVGEQCVANPEDGFTYEFFFRIWPNTNYTQDVTRDHIVNKSHIYVYSAPTLSNVKDNECGQPIAKFSIARLTNFYVFGENIAIPDKPVCYKATFIYSVVERKWITLDYYQLPDHIFLGPIGFVDPQNPANLDLNNDVLGEINPNASTIGYETGAFPLFQDPFSNPDLTPYRVSGDTELDIYRNRII